MFNLVTNSWLEHQNIWGSLSLIFLISFDSLDYGRLDSHKDLH